jgi:hypothetical protein
MYMIAALRETLPHRDFIDYGIQTQTKQVNDDRHLPESPLYCRPSGFQTIKKCLSPSSSSFKLLETLRLLSVVFIRQSEMSLLSPLQAGQIEDYWQQGQPTVASLCRDIFAIPSADSRWHEFKTSNDKYIFEALRLAAVLYAFALLNGVPFSEAGAMLSSDASGQQQAGPASWHIVVKSVLIRTNLSDAWGNMAGVLLWITLVAGAGTNLDSPSSTPREETVSPDGSRVGEEEEARKWLAAVAVRCSIVLSFEYGGAMLETLRRMVGIEQILAKTNAERTNGASPRARVAGRALRKAYGPEEPLWRTFNDFANDFRSGS